MPWFTLLTLTLINFCICTDLFRLTRDVKRGFELHMKLVPQVYLDVLAISESFISALSRLFESSCFSVKSTKSSFAAATDPEHAQNVCRLFLLAVTRVAGTESFDFNALKFEQLARYAQKSGDGTV